MQRSRGEWKRGWKVFHSKCGDLGADLLMFRNQKLNLLSWQCRYFCLCEWLPDLFLQGVQMYLLKVRTMWLIRAVIGNGNKTLTRLSACVSLCVNGCACECVCWDGGGGVVVCYLLTCDTLVGRCKLWVWEAAVTIVSIIALQPFWGAIWPQYEGLSIDVGHICKTNT